MEAVGEGALEDHGAQPAQSARGTPEGLGGAGVSGVDHPRGAVVHDEAGGGDGVAHGDRSHPKIADTLFALRPQLLVAKDGRALRGQAREIRPDDVVEQLVAERLDDGANARDCYRPLAAADGERLRQVGETGRVIEVRVGDEGVLDDELLGDGEGARDGARIDEHAVVNEERGGSLPGTLAAKGAEHADLHARAIVAHMPQARRMHRSGRARAVKLPLLGGCVRTRA